MTYVDNESGETVAVNLTATETADTYTFTMPNGEVTVDCTFTMIGYEIVNVGEGGLAVEVTDETPEAHNFGEEMTVTYTESDGYDYTLKITGKKTGNDVEVSDGKFTMPSEDIEVVLTRTPVDYTIAAVTTSHVTISAAEEEGTVPAAGGKFNVEAPVKFKVAADAGYENIVVSYKTVEGTSDEGETIYSEPTVVTAVDEVYTISALKPVVIGVTASAKTYSIATANSKYMDDTTDGEYADGAKGTSIVPESAATDSTVEIEVTANEGYTVAAVEYAYTPDGAEEATTAGAVYNEETSKFEFTMPAAEISSVTIKYAAVRNNVTVDAVNCEVKGNVENVQVNTTVTFTITPDENYRVNKNNITVTCGDKSVDFTLTGNELSFTMPNGEVTVAVAPTAEYEITAADIMDGIVTFKNLTTATGATEFTSSVMAIDGDEIEIKVESSDGYTPVAVYYGDDEVTADHDTGKYIVTAAAGKTVSVEYDVQEYTITADSVDGKYDLEVSETKLGVGEYVSGTVTAADGYKVTGVEVTYGVEQTVAVKFNDKTGKFNFTMPAGNVTVKAVYEAVDYTVTVTEKSLPDKGEVTLTVGGSAADAFHVGDIVTVKTKVENGYKHTISVKDAEGNSLLADGAETSTSKSFTFTMPAGDVTIEVSYEGRTYGIAANDATYKNEDRVYTAPEGTELPTYSVSESASAGSEVVISAAGLGVNDSVKFVVTSLGEQLVDKDDSAETFTFEMPIGAVTIDVEFNIFVQEVADAQAEYAEAIAAAKEITDAEVPAYGEEAIAALSAVVKVNTLDEAALRSRTAEEISAAAKAITDKIAEMDLEQAKADLNKIIAGVPAADEYTEESYAAVTEAVDAANELLASDEATVDALGEAGNAITAAVEKLVTKLETAKVERDDAVAAANVAIEAAGEYAPEQVEALQTAIDEANAAENVEDIIAKTEAVKAATETLNKAVEEAKKLEEAKAAYAEAETAANAAIEAAGEYAADEVAALKAAMAVEATTADEYNAKTEAVKAATEALNKAVEEAKKAIPQNVKAEAVDNGIKLTWSAVDGATSYRVYRADSATGEKTLVKTVGTLYGTDTTVTAGKTYYYFVAAYNSKTGVLFAYSEYAIATAPAATAPSITSATANGNSVRLTWSAVDGATSYRVYRADSATGTKTLVKTVGTLYGTDTTVTAGKTYYYFVAAYSSKTGKLSAYSEAEHVTI